MGRRRVGWEDESVQSGFSDHKEQQYKGEKGVKDILRVVTDCEEYRVHEIDNVFKNDKGEYITFNVVCGKHWSDEEEDWAGPCEACDKEYDAKTKFIAGVLKVGVIKGKSDKVAKVEAHQCVFYWAFGNDKYEQLRDIVFNLKQLEDGAKTLKQVELLVTCGKAKDAVLYQKLNISVWGGKQLTTKPHMVAAKEGIRELLEAASAPTSEKEMKRRLKKKRKARDEDEDGDNDSEEEKPKTTKKKTRRKAGSEAKEPEDEPAEEEEGSEESEDDGEGTGDPEMDELMAEI